MKIANLVRKLSLAQLREMLKSKQRSERLAPLEAKRGRLLAALAKVDRGIALLSGGTVEAAQAKPERKRRLSAAGRRRIIAATKARWARVRAEKAAKKGR